MENSNPKCKYASFAHCRIAINSRTVNELLRNWVTHLKRTFLQGLGHLRCALKTVTTETPFPPLSNPYWTTNFLHFALLSHYEGTLRTFHNVVLQFKKMSWVHWSNWTSLAEPLHWHLVRSARSYRVCQGKKGGNCKRRSRRVTPTVGTFRNRTYRKLEIHWSKKNFLLFTKLRWLR